MNKSREYALVLMQKARDDEWMLNRLTGDLKAPDWGLGFHAQQAVEKAIKAVLTSRSIEYPYSHNLSLLLDLLQENGLSLPPDAEQLPSLTPFGAPLRYDGEPQVIQQEIELDRSWLEACVRRTLEWAEPLLDR